MTVAACTSHSPGEPETNIAATPTTASTKTTVRSTTPIWQASNSTACARADGRVRSEDAADGVADKIAGLRIRRYIG